MKLTGQTLGTLAKILDSDSASPFTNVVLDGSRIFGFCRGRSTTVPVRFTVAETAFEPAGCIPVAWLKRLNKIVGKRRAVELNGEAEPRNVRAKIGATIYNAQLLDADAAPVFPEAKRGTTSRLAPADFAKGGAIAVAAQYASTDSNRRNLNAVHLDGLISATNGQKITRRKSVADLRGLDALVPLETIQAVIAIAQREAPREVECWKYDPAAELHRIRFRLETEAGTWEVDSPVNVEKAPDYAVAAQTREGERLVSVDAADLRELWWPFRRDRGFKVAIYETGLVCWGDYDSGVGTTLDVLPEAPVAVLAGKQVAALAKLLPKDGQVSLGIAPGTVRFADEVFGSFTDQTGACQGVPEYVQEAFGKLAKAA